jgi:hypothetical protein
MKTALRGEYGIWLGMLSQLTSLEPSGKDSENPREGITREIPARLLSIPSVNFPLRTKALSTLRSIYEKLPTGSRQANEVLAAAKRFDEELDQQQGILDKVVKQILPPMDRTASVFVRAQIAGDLLRILAASLAQPTGIKIPANLPLDPFSGKPFRATQNGSSIRIWSVGPDLVDDGGDPIWKKDQRTANGEPKLDITVGYPYVPKSVAEQRAYGAAWLGTLRKP